MVRAAQYVQQGCGRRAVINGRFAPARLETCDGPPLWRAAVTDGEGDCSMGFNTYDFGDLVPVKVVFRSAIGASLDPDVVHLRLVAPDGTDTVYTYGSGPQIVRDDVGVYHANIDAEQPGMWSYRWWSTGNGQAAKQRRFNVRQ